MSGVPGALRENPSELNRLAGVTAGLIPCRIECEIDLFVQEAALVANDHISEPVLRAISDQKTEPARIWRDIKDQAGSERLTRTQRPIERGGSSFHSVEGGLCPGGWQVDVAVVIVQKNQTVAGLQRSITAVGRNGVLVEPRLQTDDYKLALSAGLLRLRTEGCGRLNVRYGVRDVAIHFAEIFPSSTRKNFFVADERGTEKQERVAPSNQRGQRRADDCSLLGAPNGSIDERQEADA